MSLSAFQNTYFPYSLLLFSTPNTFLKLFTENDKVLAFGDIINIRGLERIQAERFPGNLKEVNITQKTVFHKGADYYLL